jgi:uncharacterized protein YggE
MKKILLVFMISMNSVFAQVQPPPLITVTGESVVKVTPNYVILGIRIKKQLTPGMDNKPAFEIFKEEDTKIRLFDFKEEDLSRTLIQRDSSAYYKEVFIAIYDLKKLDKYLLELYNLGYTDFIYVDYRTSFYERYKTEAHEAAMADAKKKAQLLATQLGQTIGKAYTIEETGSEDYNWYSLKDKLNAQKITFKTGTDHYVIEPGYITITSRIRVSFMLP